MIILDTNVLDAALRSKIGASHYILKAILEDKLQAAASTALFLEYEDVLKRKAHLKHFLFTEAEVEIILTALASKLIPVFIRYQWRGTLPDPSDEMVLECAINGYADTIITFNIRDYRDAERFGVRVLKPGDFLRSQQ